MTNPNFRFSFRTEKCLSVAQEMKGLWRNVSTIKHGGENVMVWGCFQNNKPEKLVIIDAKLNKQKYLKIL